jgi:hypothetical protein
MFSVAMHNKEHVVWFFCNGEVRFLSVTFALARNGIGWKQIFKE